MTTVALTRLTYIQVFVQPFFGFVEDWFSRHWPENKFITREHGVDVPFCGIYHVNFFRLVWRTAYVIVTLVVAMIFPFFNDFLGLIGAVSFWPLAVYFPIEMHIAQLKIPNYSFRWIWLKLLSWACLVVSLIAATGSVQGLIKNLKTYKLFQN